MKVYADSGLLCSLYAPDAHTAKAIVMMQSVPSALPVIWLHQLELRNALRLRFFRREITSSQKEASLNLFLADLAHGILVHAYPDLADLQHEAERLSASFSERIAMRSLDILHVAAALVLGVEEFWSFDTRQLALATACGLRTG